jgi:hypothetical protein
VATPAAVEHLRRLLGSETSSSTVRSMPPEGRG